MDIFKLEGKVAVITGAARGMGRAHAFLLSEAGAKIIVSDIHFDECEKVVEEIIAKGGNAKAIKCDVSKKEEVNSMIVETIKNFGKIDILVNNAGIVDFKNFLELSEEDWDRVMNINLKGYFLCAQAAAKEMIKQKSGNIINIGSIAMGQVGIGLPNLTSYISSKGGIAALTKSLAVDLAPYNIRVNAIAPGSIDTSIADNVDTEDQGFEHLKSRLLIKRMGRPEEVSAAVVFLASEASSYITGAILNIDGGWLAT